MLAPALLATAAPAFSAAAHALALGPAFSASALNAGAGAATHAFGAATLALASGLLHRCIY